MPAAHAAQVSGDRESRGDRLAQHRVSDELPAGVAVVDEHRYTINPTARGCRAIERQTLHDVLAARQ